MFPLTAGKSTILGHLLEKCGAVDKETMERTETEAQELGQEPCMYAWILDKTKDERERSRTIDLTLQQLEPTNTGSSKKGSNYSYTVIDCPGQRDYISNTITGTAQADVALLVVNASKDAFETGMNRNGQTREHALLAYTLGVKQVIVAINQMDHISVDYSESRFLEIKSEVAVYLRKVGYKPMKIPFIPLSGWNGDNLVEQATETMPWYQGPTLVEAMTQNVNPPKRQVDKPLRMPLQDVCRVEGTGLVPIGRIATGKLESGMKVSIAPSGIIGTVQSIEMHHQATDEASAGNHIGFHIVSDDIDEDDEDDDDIGRGSVVSDVANEPARAAKSFEAQVVVVDHPGEIRVGYCPVVDCHTAHVPCKFERIWDKTDRKTGKVVESTPESVCAGDVCTVLMEPTKPLCVEAFSECPPLGRFAIRDGQQTVAVGIIKSVTKEDEPAEDDDNDDDEQAGQEDDESVIYEADGAETYVDE